MRITQLHHKIIFAILRKRIKKNPYIGQEASGETYLYEQDGYSINYRIIKLSGGKLRIEWISHKRRLGAYEEKIRRTRQKFLDFWYYQKWLFFFRPPILLIVIVGMFLFYSEVMETQETKTARLKWMIASAVGINPKDIQYIGDGWLEASGQRRRKDQTREPIRYTFNPLRWLFFSEGGVLTRWRGEPFGHAIHTLDIHPVVYNERGDVWMKKRDTPWQHGRISGDTIKWDTPQGSRRVTDQEISVENKKLKIIDK